MFLSMLIVCLFGFKDLQLQGSVALRGRDFHSPEIGNVRDCGDDSLLLLGSSYGSFTSIRTSIHGRWL